MFGSDDDNNLLDEFFIEELDRGAPHAFLPLIARIDDGLATEVPRPTALRLDVLLAHAARESPDPPRWAMMLLDTLLDQSEAWRKFVKTAATRKKYSAVQQTLTVLNPLTSSNRSRTAYLRRVLASPGKSSSLERSCALLLVKFDIHIDEYQALESLRLNGWRSGDLIARYLSRENGSGIVVSDQFINEWITVIEACISDADQPEDIDISMLPGNFASCLSDEGRRQVLLRINDPSDSARDFLIENMLTRIDAVTTDDLTTESGTHVVNLFLDRRAFYFSGMDITESFINDIVLPIARRLRDPDKRRHMSEILDAAGKQHDKRYAVPWKWPS